MINNKLRSIDKARENSSNDHLYTTCSTLVIVLYYSNFVLTIKYLSILTARDTSSWVSQTVVTKLSNNRSLFDDWNNGGSMIDLISFSLYVILILLLSSSCCNLVCNVLQ